MIKGVTTKSRESLRRHCLWVVPTIAKTDSISLLEFKQILDGPIMFKPEFPTLSQGYWVECAISNSDDLLTREITILSFIRITRSLNLIGLTGENVTNQKIRTNLGRFARVSKIC